LFLDWITHFLLFCLYTTPQQQMDLFGLNKASRACWWHSVDAPINHSTMWGKYNAFVCVVNCFWTRLLTFCCSACTLHHSRWIVLDWIRLVELVDSPPSTHWSSSCLCEVSTMLLCVLWIVSGLDYSLFVVLHATLQHSRWIVLDWIRLVELVEGTPLKHWSTTRPCKVSTMLLCVFWIVSGLDYSFFVVLHATLHHSRWIVSDCTTPLQPADGTPLMHRSITRPCASVNQLP
jgi:hypothetical protein